MLYLTALQVLLFITVVLVTIFPQSESLSDYKTAQITSGLEVAEAIGNFVKEGKFKESLQKVGTSVANYLEVVGPFIDIVFGFIKGPDSMEVAFMKEMMKQIDARFDQMDSRFNDIERLIDWSVVQVNFGQVEQKILAMSEEYEHIYEVPPEATANRKTIFLDAYDSDYQNSGYKLYHAIVEPSGKFQEKLGVSVMRFTENDRKRTQIFLLGTLQLLLQAAKIEIVYLQAKQFTHNAEFRKNEWETRLEEVKNEFETIDGEIVKMYHSQSGKDIDKYAADNSRMSNKDFANGLKNMLKDKYYWRIWLVVIYNPISGSDNHYVRKHGGFEKYRRNGRNIVVASKDSGSPRMSSNTAQSRLNGARAFPKAKDVFNNIQPASNAGSWGVIKRGENVEYAWSGGSLTKVTKVYLSGNMFYVYERSFDLYMWG